LVASFMKTSVYAAVALIAAAAGFGIYHFAIGPHSKGPVVTDETPAPPATTESATPAVPDVLPDFTLSNLDGQPTSIKSWTGKSMIVNFWATWCAPCRREIPLLKKIQQQHGAEGFQIVGVAVDFKEDVQKFAKEIGIDYPVLVGEQDGLEAVNKFGQGSIGFPFTAITDNQQRIVLFHVGEIHEQQAEVFLDAVRKVNSGELTPASARAVVAKQLQEMAPAQE